MREGIYTYPERETDKSGEIRIELGYIVTCTIKVKNSGTDSDLDEVLNNVKIEDTYPSDLIELLDEANEYEPYSYGSGRVEKVMCLYMHQGIALTIKMRVFDYDSSWTDVGNKATILDIRNRNDISEISVLTDITRIMNYNIKVIKYISQVKKICRKIW